MKYRFLFLAYIALNFINPMAAEDGSHLWLRMNGGVGVSIETNAKDTSDALRIAMRELSKAWKGNPIVLTVEKDRSLSPEGFRLRCEGEKLTISSPSPIGLLYGAYHLLRLQESGQEINSTTENPAYALRILNHWDNADGTVERGYAEGSLWQWDALPDTLSERYEAYARANASIGVNGTVLNNVNASPQILSTTYLRKVKALADVFRPYGIRVYLSVNFASPIVVGGLPTADPCDKRVALWWKDKVREIYSLVPDFGGFLVKANSEGQPGPCDYGRTHAEGANMLADALLPYKGIVMWRAFVYNPSDTDRAKQAYTEFKPLDGKFRRNVILQVKNGPIDFQPREPYNPLFGAMTATPLMAEFQITQEYLGHSNHLVYLAPMWKEFFRFVPPSSLKAVAGVANIGSEHNWCGHHFAQANWYAFGRLAWNPSLTAEEIAGEWLKQTFCTDTAFVAPVSRMMTASREAAVDYMMPLGLHHIFAWGHHYGPEPWCNIPGARRDWMPAYYHNADSMGVGFDRSHTGSHATAQYPDSLHRLYDSLSLCPEEYLLWFHHVAWTHRMKSGETLWESLCRHYDRGVQQVREFQKIWDEAERYVDSERFLDVQSRLKTQVRDAVWWKDACLLYFQSFSQMPFPTDMERPVHELRDMKRVNLGISNYECPSKELLNKIR